MECYLLGFFFAVGYGLKELNHNTKFIDVFLWSIAVICWPIVMGYMTLEFVNKFCKRFDIK